MRTDRAEFLGLSFDLLSQEQVLDRLSKVTGETAYSYVVTPNVDHVVRLHETPDAYRRLVSLYESASLCLCDSKILHLLAKFYGTALPVVPGSELTAVMFERVIHSGDRIAVVGGDKQLLAQLRQRYPHVDFVHHCPPMGLRSDADARHACAQFIAESGARFSFIAVGSPQQEMIASEVRAIPEARGTALCIGASLEFLTGQLQRAPRLLQRMSLEWAHRLFSDPRRLWRRYLVEGPRIFLLAHRWSGSTQGSVSE